MYFFIFFQYFLSFLFNFDILAFKKLWIIKLKFQIIIFMVFVAFWGCECVTKIDTPKIISPDDYANVIFVNSIVDRDIVTVESNKIPLLHKVHYAATENSYQKVYSGDSFFNLVDNNKSNLINIPVNLDKFTYSTIIFYGRRYSIKAKILNDSIELLGATNALIRIVHTSIDAPEVQFRLKGKSDSTFNLKFQSNTHLFSIEPGEYSIDAVDIHNGEVISSSRVFNVKKSSIINAVLKGTINSLPDKPLIIDIISTVIE